MEKNKLFVAGLPWAVTNENLREMFAQYGEISDAVVITDRDTGRSKGFGFVTFVREEDAQKALEMSGKQVEDRTLTVSVAKPRENRPGGGFGGGGGGPRNNNFRRDNNRRRF